MSPLFVTSVVVSAAAMVILAWRVWRDPIESSTWTWSLLGLGAAAWVVAKIPKGLLLWPFFGGASSEADVARLLAASTALLFLAALAAGLFEEGAKLLGVAVVRGRTDRRYWVRAGWLIGLGTGAIEFVNFCLAEFLRHGAAASAMVPVERLAIAVLHGSLGALAARFAASGFWIRGWLLAAALHAGIDVLIPYVQLHGIVAEGVRLSVFTVAVAGVISLGAMRDIRRRATPIPGNGQLSTG